MKQAFAKQSVPFVQIANAVLEDKKISFKAKGLFAYLYSKPETWDFSAERIVKASDDGPAAVYSGLKELEKAGYLTREKKGDGRVVYQIYWEPIRENPKLGKPLTAETVGLSNTELESNTEEKIHIAEASSAPPKADSFYRKKAKDDAVPMTLGEFLLMMRGSAYRHARLIGEYADERQTQYQTRGQWRVFMGRNLRSARDLAPYTDHQIADAITRLKKDYAAMERKNGQEPKWTMETIIKYLDEANSKN